VLLFGNSPLPKATHFAHHGAQRAQIIEYLEGDWCATSNRRSDGPESLDPRLRNVLLDCGRARCDFRFTEPMDEERSQHSFTRLRQKLSNAFLKRAINEQIGTWTFRATSLLSEGHCEEEPGH
jgi:hypothetical protein